MPKKRFSSEQIIAKLRQIEVPPARTHDTGGARTAATHIRDHAVGSQSARSKTPLRS